MVVVLLLIATPLYLLRHERRSAVPEPVQTLSRYLKASYARDFKQAYRFISSKDKELKPEKVYVREKGASPAFSKSGENYQTSLRFAHSASVRDGSHPGQISA